MLPPRTPEIIRLLVEPCASEELDVKPAPDRFSIAEVLAHLHHAEVHCYGVRVRQIIQEPDSLLEPYDTKTYEIAGEYAGKEALVTLTQFEIARKENLQLLASVSPEMKVRHGRLGRVTAANVIHEWACHDLGHIRQIAELVRWLRHWPHLGPWQPEYTIRP